LHWLSLVLHTSDGGQSWVAVGKPTFDPIFDIAASLDSAVYTSSLGTFYSNQTNGSYVFLPSQKAAFGADVEAFNWQGVDDGYGYGVVGPCFDVKHGNGVWISTDSGQTFSFTNISVLLAPGRFGAYPSSTTWFIAAGAYPNVTNEELANHIGKPPPVSPLIAQMAKTTDGGHTWQTVFYSERQFIFNHVACWSELSCVVLADSELYQSTISGVTILTTKDGGQTWNITYNQNAGGTSMSISAVQFVSETEVWACGNYQFYHSTDAGWTWELVFTPWIVYDVTDIAFVSPNVGYAVGASFEIAEGAFMTWIPTS